MSIVKHLKTSLLMIILLGLSQQVMAEFIPLKSFGDNPGELQGTYFLPTKGNVSTSSVSLVVLLHGCAQNAETLALQSGLLGLAKKHNFALLLPQQALTNNIKQCFNWYSEDDFSKDSGESLSIKNMVTTLKSTLSSEQVFIIGLSAGGAMTSSLLVNYPDLFDAGAVVAGIPFPCADGLITGISCMKNGPSQSGNELVKLAKKINPIQQKWPKLSVWTGSTDNIVNPLNATMLALQWSKLSNIHSKPMVKKHIGYNVSQWQNAAKEVQVELVEILKRGHGIMVNPEHDNGGEVADYLLSSPVSTAVQVLEFWGIKGDIKITP